MAAMRLRGNACLCFAWPSFVSICTTIFGGSLLCGPARFALLGPSTLTTPPPPRFLYSVLACIHISRRRIASKGKHRSVWLTALRASTATVQKIVTEILPSSSGIAFAKEARDLLIECCVEFISLVSSEANEISEKDAKKTIACDHITKALEHLGFADYVPAVLEAAAEHKEVQKVGNSVLTVRL